MAKNHIKISLAVILIGAIIILSIMRHLGLVNLDVIFNYVRTAGYKGWLLFLAIMIFGVVLGFPCSVMDLSGGYLFGPKIGFVLVMVGANIASIIAFSLSRYLFRDYFHKRFAHNRILRWSKIEDQKKLTSLVLSLRILHIIPFSILNYGLGLTKVKTWNYVWATFLFMIPETFAYVYLGTSLKNIVSWQFLVALGIIAVFAITFYFLKKNAMFEKSGEIDIRMGSNEIKVNKRK